MALPLVLAVSGAPVFGWAKPVPVDGSQLRNPRLHMMLVALAGPGMNLLLALFAVFALAAALGGGGRPEGGVHLFLVANLQNFLVINIFLAFFNLLPIPPFDGGHVVEGLLPRPLAMRWRRFGRLGFPLVILLLVVLPMVSDVRIVERLVVPPIRAALDFYLALAGL